MKTLTQQQQRILKVFLQCAKLGSPPPSHRELCREFGWSSTATARDHIRALVRKGVLLGAEGRARGAHLVRFPSRKTSFIRSTPSVGKRALKEPASADDLQKPLRTSSNPTGEAAAAELNRQRQARIRITEMLQRLGVPSASWPSFVHAPLPLEAHYKVIPPSFQPPMFQRLHESIREWKASADTAWKNQRDRFIRAQQSWIEMGMDEEIAEEKRARSPGTKGNKRKNSVVTMRYEWAAKRLCGYGWKEISNAHLPDTVRKAASELLRLAGWPIKLSEIKAARHSSAK